MIVINAMCVLKWSATNVTVRSILVKIVQLEIRMKFPVILADINRVVATVVIAAMGTAIPDLQRTTVLSEVVEALTTGRVSPGYRQHNSGYRHHIPGETVQMVKKNIGFILVIND